MRKKEENLTFIKNNILNKLSIYVQPPNCNLLYIIKAESSKNPLLLLLLQHFYIEDDEIIRLNLVEKILFQLTGAEYISTDFYGKYINSQYFFALEILDYLSIYSFSYSRLKYLYSDVEMANIVNCEFEDLKLNLYVLLVSSVSPEKNIDVKIDMNIFTSIFESILMKYGKYSGKMISQFFKVIKDCALLKDSEILGLKSKVISMLQAE